MKCFDDHVLGPCKWWNMAHFGSASP